MTPYVIKKNIVTPKLLFLLMASRSQLFFLFVFIKKFRDYLDFKNCPDLKNSIVAIGHKGNSLWKQQKQQQTCIKYFCLLPDLEEKKKSAILERNKAYFMVW